METLDPLDFGGHRMDVDSNDGTVTESLNGETKPDVAKLAQTAIIKQVRVTTSLLHCWSAPSHFEYVEQAEYLFTYAGTHLIMNPH